MTILMTLSIGSLEFEVRSSDVAPYPDTLGGVYLSEQCVDEDTPYGGYVGTWDRFICMFPQFADVTPPPTWHEVNCNEREYSFPYQHIADVSGVE